MRRYERRLEVQVLYQPGPPMTLGNMREQGVRGLAVYCLNHSCRHHTVINVDSYPHEIEVPSFALRMKCSKCGGAACRCAAQLERGKPQTGAEGPHDGEPGANPQFLDGLGLRMRNNISTYDGVFMGAPPSHLRQL